MTIKTRRAAVMQAAKATMFLLLVGAFTPSPVLAAAQDRAPGNGSALLSKALPGRSAVSALGGNLGIAAARSGMSPERLAQILSKDSSAWIDRNGYLYFVDPRAPNKRPSTTSSAAAAPLFPLDETFWLHSRLGAKRVIYLDFDGQRFAKGTTAWNPDQTINAPPFSLDSDTATFNDNELIRIQQIWQRVANDFAAFDVDVTTEAPAVTDLRRSSSSDQKYGTRALITKEIALPGGCDCGGIAYVGTFDDAGQHSYYQPAWVFFDNLAGGEAKAVAEAISHEVGHNLGLSHDGSTTGCSDGSGGNTAACGYYSGHGSGPTGWAPIMGVGYSRPLTQWSKGEYPNADNTEDDYAVIASNGVAAARDDFPVGIASGYNALKPLAGGLSGGSMVVDQSGLIERPTDRDYFAFEASAGALQVTATPLGEPGSNIDLSLKLFDANGQQFPSTPNDPEQLGVTLSVVNLPAGRYYLVVQGTGDELPPPGYSAYGSVGRYRLGGSVPAEDTTPEPFVFTNISNAALDTAVQSDYVTVSGITAAAPISVVGSTGAYQIEGQALTNAAGTISNGQRVRVRLKASANGDEARSLTLTVGGYSTTWTVTSRAADATPDAFTFTNLVGAKPDTAVQSEYVTISGIEAGAPISVTGVSGAYQIEGQTLTTAAGTISNGQRVRVRLKAAVDSGQSRNLTLTVGGYSTAWTVTTQ